MRTVLASKILLLFLFFSIYKLSSAQNFINEDFLDNIENNAKSMWNEDISAFKVNAAPDKYEEESGTILGWRRSVSIDKKSRIGFLSKGERSLVFFENVRFKILLNDKNAVQRFTAIYFRYFDKEDGFSARIIKPGGEINVISLNDAVGVEASSEMPEFFKSFFDVQSGDQRRYFKVAVPNLEPGDILEYVTVTKNKLNVLGSGYIEFTPQYELCNKSYPILFNQIVIDTDDKSFFKSMSLNGAPEFKKENASESGFFRFVFTDHDRGVEKDVNFINAYQVYPLTKFQVIYSNNEKAKGALIGSKGEIKKSFSKEELAKKAWEDYIMVGDLAYGNGTVQNYIDFTWAELKKLGAKDWSEKEYINKVYYKMRNIVVNRDTYLADKVAAYMFGSLLFQRDIKSELIITISNSIGTLSNVLFDEEIRYLCKINENYYFNPTDHSNPGDLVESLLGCEAYIIAEPAKKTGAQEIKPITLADATFGDNTVNYAITASLATDMSKISMNRVSTYTGISKNREVNDALKYTIYPLDDYKNYGGNSPTDRMNEAQEEDYYKSVRALKDHYKETKPEDVKQQLQNEFAKKVKLNDFSIVSDGRSLKMKNLSVKEDFELSGMIRKAGKKYLINLTGLVGGQLQIKKEERIRQHDINVGYARTLNWVINFKIPPGYTVDGLKELNVSYDSEAGSFASESEEKDGMVILKIKKVYKRANLPKDKWNDMLSFVDLAYNNSHKYILLKPKN